MIIGKDIHPEREIYYLGALVLDILQKSPEKELDFFYIYQKVNESEKISIKLFILTLDWLFILGAIINNKGNIKNVFKKSQYRKQWINNKRNSFLQGDKSYCG